MHEPRLLMVWVMTLAAALVAGRASGQDPAIALDPPPAGVFVIDHAEMLDAAQRQTLETLGRTLLEENQTPLVVVTIESMSAHWPHGDIRIETFAHLLFDQWEIGIADLAGETWNTGILLLVSKGDRRARIQLGAGWGRDEDRECSRIMDRTIIPQFKRGRFGDGIVKGAEALDAMARGRALPAGASAQGSGAAPRAGSGASPRRSSRVAGMMPIIGCFGLIVLVGIIGVALVTIKQMRGDQSHKSYRSLDERDDGEDDDEDEGGGRKGLGFWSGWLAGQLLSSGRGGSSGGGFFGGRGYSSGSRGGLGGGGFSGGGGSSGGGFSGGGGASGGW